MRILVVEDYSPLRLALSKGLREAAYAVDATADGNEAEWHATATNYDVIILDIMLPGKSGLDVLSSLRARGIQSAVILLTARDTVLDKIAGLDFGADDYLVKPFDFQELLARIRSLTRRRSAAKSSKIIIGDLELDRAIRSASRSGVTIELSAREFSLLELLALRSGEIVSRSEMWEKLYEDTSEVSSNVVDVFVGLLRRKLERDGLPRLIHTRRGYGYVLESLT